MLFFKQHRIYRNDIQANPKVLYIFGDNLDREGMGGQAAEMRGEPNSFGIATKRGIGHGYPHDFFFDSDDDAIELINDEFDDLQAVLRRGRYEAVCIPSDGIGTGLSKLPEYAPKLLEHIEKKFKETQTLFKD